MKQSKLLVAALSKIIIVGLLVITNFVYADTPRTLSYQGFLTNDDGTLVNSLVSINFSIYDQATDGSILWNETSTVNVDNGVFNIKLGADTNNNPLDTMLFSQPLWVGIGIDGDAEMSPRDSLKNAPYAFQAENSKLLDGLTSAEIISAAGGSGSTCGEIIYSFVKADTSQAQNCMVAAQTFSCPNSLTLVGAEMGDRSTFSVRPVSGFYFEEPTRPRGVGFLAASTTFTENSVTTTCSSNFSPSEAQTRIDAGQSLISSITPNTRVILTCCR